MFKKIATAVSVAALLVGVPAAAHADPKKADVITLNCDSGQSYEIAVFSNGTWSPGLLTNGNGVVRPVAVSVTGTFTPADGSPPETFTESAAKHVGAKTQTTDCTFSETGSDESGSFTLEGTVTIVIPRH